ncbi:hypothetical protein RYR39_002549 [Yersinia ruckeri]|nr:hypothetical protein [Yersinia ruckeri]
MNWIELDWIELDWIGLDWIGLDWIGLDWISEKIKLGERSILIDILDASQSVPNPSRALKKSIIKIISII